MTEEELILEEKRRLIDRIDDRIAGALADRFVISRTIMDLKRDEDLPAEDKTREDEIVDRIIEEYPSLDESLVKGIYWLIFDNSKKDIAPKQPKKLDVIERLKKL